MRPCFVAATALLMAFSSVAWAAEDQVGLPAHAFVLTWTPLPTGHFALVSPTMAPMRVHDARAMPVYESRMTSVLDGAFISAADAGERREIAMNEMMSPWARPQRSAFQHLREAATAYAATDAQHADRFAALAKPVVDGTGRSAAVDGSASSALDTAYAAALSRQNDGARAKTEAAQESFRRLSRCVRDLC